MTTASGPGEYPLAVAAVVASGLLWATGPVFVKSMREPAQFIRQYLWVRMGVLVVCYATYLTALRAFWRWRRRRLEKDASRDDASRKPDMLPPEVPLRALICLARLSPAWRIFGVLGMSTAMSGFVISLTMVPAAATLCELAASPFFAALIGRALLGERVSRTTWLSMVVCAGGIVMFAFDEGGSPVASPGIGNFAANGTVSGGSNDNSNSDEISSDSISSVSGANPVVGNILGILSSAGFACYSVTLRVLPSRHLSGGAKGDDADDSTGDNDRNADMALVVRLYGLIFSMWAAFLIVLATSILMLFEHTGPFEMPGINVELSAWHGMFIFAGFCFFTLGAPKLPAPELILLTMLEVVGGILLTYFVLGELPGPLGLVGASLIVVAVVCNGVGNGCAKKREESSERDMDDTVEF